MLESIRLMTMMVHSFRMDPRPGGRGPVFMDWKPSNVGLVRTGTTLDQNPTWKPLFIDPMLVKAGMPADFMTQDLLPEPERTMYQNGDIILADPRIDLSILDMTLQTLLRQGTAAQKEQLLNYYRHREQERQAIEHGRPVYPPARRSRN